MSIQELETQLLALTPVEKAEAIQILTRTLGQGSSGISKMPGVCGGEACVAQTRIPVWLLVSYRQQGSRDAELLEFYSDLSA